MKHELDVFMQKHSHELDEALSSDEEKSEKIAPFDSDSGRDN